MLCTLLAPFAGWSQSEAAPAAPAAPKGAVHILFLPPPMEGTLSLGIYTPAGKLIRTLRAEADVQKDFIVADNGLIAKWDGLDDQGQPAPAGEYRARGFAVGDLGLSGEAVLANDWYEGDESPRVSRIVSLDGVAGEHLLLTAQLADGQTVALQADRLGRLSPVVDRPPTLPSPTVGRDGSRWAIEPGESGPEVRQYAKGQDEEVLRRLSITPGEPIPKQVAASATEDVIFLLEEKPGEQRLRALSLEAVEADQAQSTWKAFLLKRIVASPDFASIKAEATTAPGFKPTEKLTIRVRSNPLEKAKLNPTLGLKIAFDAQGSYLATADGLRLFDLTDTKHLRWVTAGSEGGSRSITFFQSDGAVVEQFHLRRPANIMAFDAGEYELKR